MRFSPVSEDQASRVWPKGEYDATVEAAIETTSKSSGNDMLEVHLKVYGQNGKEQKLRDYLVHTEGGAYKFQRFCKSAGQWDAYQAGEITGATFQNANVTVKLGEEKGTDDFPPRNKVLDYMPTKLDTPAPKATRKPPGELAGVSSQQQRSAGPGRPDPSKPPTEDEIPF